MAPLKQINKQPTLPTLDRGIKTRSQHVSMKKDLSKRKADESPLKRITVKRSALGVVAHNENIKENERSELLGKQVLKQAAVSLRETRSRTTISSRKPFGSVNTQKPPLPPAAGKPVIKEVQVAETSKSKIADKDTKDQQPTALTKSIVKSAIVKTTAVVSVLPRPTKTQVKLIKKQPETSLPKTNIKTRHSDADKSDNSLYVSALEDLNLDDAVKDKNGKFLLKKKQRKPPPVGIEDFDKENINEPNSVSIYAMDIFEYLKSRESNFKISDYIWKQSDLNSSMRALVINWMVEVQENFELNHETLYLAVKLFDLYLSKVIVTKSQLQLIGCASLFVAAKYDERFPPTIEDMLYVCDGLYKTNDLTSMEIDLLKTVDFQLGIPLSYRFLRRYARCSKQSMPTLTLARYILESSLLDYSIIRYSDSKLASAALHLALIMIGQKEWSSTLEYYSGYKAEEFRNIIIELNGMLHKNHNKQVAVNVKYSHPLFHEVANIPLVDTSSL